MDGFNAKYPQATIFMQFIRHSVQRPQDGQPSKSYQLILFGPLCNDGDALVFISVLYRHKMIEDQFRNSCCKAHTCWGFETGRNVCTTGRMSLGKKDECPKCT